VSFHLGDAKQPKNTLSRKENKMKKEKKKKTPARNQSLKSARAEFRVLVS